MVVPDLHDRGRGDADRLGHRTDRLARRFVVRQFECQRHHLVDQRSLKRRDAGKSGLVAQQTVDPFGREALLPAPHAGFRLRCRRHDRQGTQPPIGQQNDPCLPDMLLRRSLQAEPGLRP
jgi:hypothetical protein